MHTLTLDRKEIPSELLRAFPAYKGKKFTLVQATKVTLSDTYWSGGTKSTYALVRLQDGASRTAPADSPFDRLGIEGQTYEIPTGFAVVEHVMFCGKDLGLRFHVRPENLTGLLPGTDSATRLSPLDRAILGIFAGLKAFAREEYLQRLVELPDGSVRDDYLAAFTGHRDFDLRRADWRAGRESLIERGLLVRNKAGAISMTKEGRRALELNR